MTTRRDFMKSATAGIAAARLFAQDKRMLAYVGTYSSPEGPEGSRGNGKGIYLFEMDPASGALSQRSVFETANNPSWLALDPSRTHLYSGDETSKFEGAKSGSVSAYAIDRASGHLTHINSVTSGGAGPAHISVHPSGKFVFAANYGGGTVAVIPIQQNAKLGQPTDVIHLQGTVGAQHATSAPPGSFAASGHDTQHAHMIQSDAAGRFVIATDLGTDRIYVWKFDANAGKLIAAETPFVTVPPGDGPRHFAFHPNGRWMYSLQEEGSTLISFDYDAATGKLTAKGTVSTLPKGFAGTNYTSEVMVSSDGKFVYAANRLHDSIAWLPIGADGTLTFGGAQATGGDYPRSFNIDPSGNFLYSCNQRADEIASFRVDRQTGALTPTGQYIPVGTPAAIVFLT